MTKLSQAALLKQLRTARDPAVCRDTALDLLTVSRDREKIDAALAALLDDDVIDLLDDAHRDTLRARFVYYAENPAKDRGGLIREQVTRLLTAIGHPGDRDIYMQGCATYHRQPNTDSAQNLRAAALVGLSHLDRELACAYAVRLLGEPDTSTLNGQPSVTAINVLAHHGQRLPVYLFVLRQGADFIQQGNGEVVAKALEALAVDFPAALFAELAESVVAQDVPVVVSGLVNAITAARLVDLYPLLERIITRTRHDDLHHYTLVMLAAARDDALIAMLYRLARESTPARAGAFLAAVELTTGDERDALLAWLARRGG